MNKSFSKNGNNQEIVPVKIESDNSEGDKIKPNIRALPNSSIFTELMTKKIRKPNVQLQFPKNKKFSF